MGGRLHELASLLCFTLISASTMAQAPRQPNLDAQRAAMKKLEFLVGKWNGDAQVLLSETGPKELAMTELAEYRLDGLVLTIEGVGRDKKDGKPALQAFGVVSYDDASGTYHMRAFNNGQFLETGVKLAGDGRGLSWGFTIGEYQTHSTMSIDDTGDWTEHHEISVGASPPKPLMELKVRRQQ
jgi:hypothetical protein